MTWLNKRCLICHSSKRDVTPSNYWMHILNDVGVFKYQLFIYHIQMVRDFPIVLCVLSFHKPKSLTFEANPLFYKIIIYCICSSPTIYFLNSSQFLQKDLITPWFSTSLYIINQCTVRLTSCKVVSYTPFCFQVFIFLLVLPPLSFRWPEDIMYHILQRLVITLYQRM